MMLTMSKPELLTDHSEFNKQFDYESYPRVAEGIREMTECWGARFIDDGEIGVLKSSWWNIEPQITIVANLQQGGQDICIRKSDTASSFFGLRGEDVYIPLKGSQSFENSESGLFVPVNKQDGLLTIDKNIYPHDIFIMTGMIMMKQEEKGLYDSETSIMKPSHEIPYVPKEKLRVDEIFHEIGTSFIILPGIKGEDLKDTFDHPELLTTGVNPYGGEGAALIHKSHLPYHNKKTQVVNEILLKKNLTLPDIFEGMQIDPDFFSPLLKSIKNEIDERMRKWLKENEGKLSN